MCVTCVHIAWKNNLDSTWTKWDPNFFWIIFKRKTIILLSYEKISGKPFFHVLIFKYPNIWSLNLEFTQYKFYPWLKKKSNRKIFEILYSITWKAAILETSSRMISQNESLWIFGIFRGIFLLSYYHAILWKCHVQVSETFCRWM